MKASIVDDMLSKATTHSTSTSDSNASSLKENTPSEGKKESEKSENTLISIDPNKDIFENILITLKTLQAQNTRLAKFQQDSYKFHLQHHANIKKIISGLNMLSENFERFGMKSFELRAEEDKQLLDGHADPSAYESATMDFNMRKTLHDKVTQNANNMQELDSILRSVNDIDTFKELKASSVSIILPLLESWLQEIDDARMGFVFLYESARRFPESFSFKANCEVVMRMIKVIENMGTEYVEKIDFDENCIREIYQFLTNAIIV